MTTTTDLRYFVAKQCGLGSFWQFWNVCDSQQYLGPAVAGFGTVLPNAEQQANLLCNQLNGSV